MQRLLVATTVFTILLMFGGLVAAQEGPSAAGAFESAGSLAEARELHTATLLPDGRTLVIGGRPTATGEPFASAEVWDPRTASFRPAGQLTQGRSGHTATLLPDGRVLVIGGSPGGSSTFFDFLDSAEIWDPDTESFGPAGSLTTARFGHAATLLPDGRVFVVGGEQGATGSAEIWDPDIESFGPAGSPEHALRGPTASLLLDGRVLVVGGTRVRDRLTSVEVWDPVSTSFGPAGPLDEERWSHQATQLADGRVLLLAGTDAPDLEAVASLEAWDPVTSTSGYAGSLAEARVWHAATPLHDGRVLIVGGWDGEGVLASAEVWDPEPASSGPAGRLAEARSNHTATFLRDGRVLVIGGSGSDGSLASAELWTSAAKPAKCFGKRPTLFALPGVEFVGTAGADVIAGSIGADKVDGGGGSDRICSGRGDDSVTGGGGNDRIDGGPGDDEVNGGKGKDVCVGGKGTDWLPGCNDKKRTRGTVTVNKNLKLKGPHKGRFIIGKNGVTLDCDGHTVTGAGPESGLTGVDVVGRKKVTVRDCDLRNHSHGFWVDRSHRNAFINNRVANVGADGFALIGALRNRLTANSVSDSGGAGYLVREGSDGNRLRDNSASGTRWGFLLTGSDNNSLVGNRVTDVEVYGAWGFGILDHSDNNDLRDNVAVNAGDNAFGVEMSNGNVFADNIATGGSALAGRTSNGFLAHDGAVRNTFTGNTATDNTGWGFADSTTGLRGDAGTDNLYEGNTCDGNGSGDASPASLCD